ncbi:MAG TPA: transcription antitermination factor NusB [Casimicrobiaceae bacterium]|nr:transcription antitermination factor NusB [Casimicrobiaceae bacterium]
MSAATARRRARERVLLGLYERQVARNADAAIAADLFEPLAAASGDGAPASGGSPLPVDAEYGRELWRGVVAHYDALLQTVEPRIDRKLGALAPVERALLVIATWELTHRLDIPYRVVIDEAVELAKVYGGTDGHKFVNGVLDKLAPTLRAAEIGAEAGNE